MRGGAQEQIEYGIKHCRQTLAACDHSTVQQYQKDFIQVIDDAEISCNLEINQHYSMKQYKIAQKIFDYQDTLVTVQKRLLSKVNLYKVYRQVLIKVVSIAGYNNLALLGSNILFLSIKLYFVSSFLNSFKCALSTSVKVDLVEQ